MKKALKIVIATIVLVIIAAIAGSVVYVNDFYRAQLPDTYTKSDKVSVSFEDNQYYFYDCEDSDKALIFYPGGKVDEKAYEPLMISIAEQCKMDCFLVKMPCHLAVFGMNRAENIMKKYDYEQWYIAGHSLGGAMACGYAQKHLNDFDGIFLMGAYSTADLTNARFPIVTIYGDKDGIMNRDNYTKYKNNLPSTYSEHIINGGNHSGYAMYGLQKNDGKADISTEEQIKQVAQIIDNYS